MLECKKHEKHINIYIKRSLGKPGRKSSHMNQKFTKTKFVPIFLIIQCGFKDMNGRLTSILHVKNTRIRHQPNLQLCCLSQCLLLEWTISQYLGFPLISKQKNAFISFVQSFKFPNLASQKHTSSCLQNTSVELRLHASGPGRSISTTFQVVGTAIY